MSWNLRIIAIVVIEGWAPDRRTLLNHGRVIPGTVHPYVLPVFVLEYAPQYRDYEYILDGDEILIVDFRTLTIVAVMAA
jgi:hypothetical protein